MIYEKVAACPPEVANLIKIANLVPWSAELKIDDSYDSSEVRDSLKDRDWRKISSGEISFDMAAIKAWIDLQFSEHPPLAEYLRQGRQYSLDAPELFRSFLKIRKFLNKLVEVSEVSRRPSDAQKLDYYVVNNRNKSEPFAYEDFEDPISIRLGGVIQFEIHPILKMIEGCELQRFRRCLICKNVYWATRIMKRVGKKADTSTCGIKKCADQLGNSRRKGKLRPKTEEDTSSEISLDRTLARDRWKSQDYSKK